jgi:hypothetical protein
MSFIDDEAGLPYTATTGWDSYPGNYPTFGQSFMTPQLN